MTGTNGNGNGNGHHKAQHAYDYRCLRCGRLWFRASLSPVSVIEIRCPKCGCMGIVTDKTVVIQDEHIDTAVLFQV